MKTIKTFYYDSKNVGDTLTPIIVKHFTGIDTKLVDRHERNKLLAVGSVMSALRNEDIVWGAGIMRETDTFTGKDECKFLAVRGKLTEKILGKNVGVYGDPALLLPLIYNPKIEVKHTIGVVGHYIEINEPFFKRMKKDGCKMIDVMQDHKTFVDEILSCDTIISSSLHGIIIAEAYGKTAKWVKVTNRVIGDGFKFADYMTGTERKLPPPHKATHLHADYQEIYHLEPLKNEVLKNIQDKLIKVLQDYAKNI